MCTLYGQILRSAVRSRSHPGDSLHHERYYGEPASVVVAPDLGGAMSWSSRVGARCIVNPSFHDVNCAASAGDASCLRSREASVALMAVRAAHIGFAVYRANMCADCSEGPHPRGRFSCRAHRRCTPERIREPGSGLPERITVGLVRPLALGRRWTLRAPMGTMDRPVAPLRRWPRTSTQRRVLNIGRAGRWGVRA